MDVETLKVLERMLPPQVPAIPTAEDFKRLAAVEWRAKRNQGTLSRQELDWLSSMNTLAQTPAFKDLADATTTSYRREVRAAEIGALQKRFDAIKAGLADWQLPQDVLAELKGLAVNPGDGRRLIVLEETHGRVAVQGAINDVREGERLRHEIVKLTTEQTADKPEAAKRLEARKALLAQAAQERAKAKAAA